MFIIKDEWHRLYSYNCLTVEQFRSLQLLASTGELPETFIVDCHMCRVYDVGEYHRCSCGNRRCYFVFDCNSEFGFSVEVD